MRVIVLDGMPRKESEPLIDHAASYLGRFGILLERVRTGRQPRFAYEDYAALIATLGGPVELRSRLDCYGVSPTNSPSRPETLGWLRRAGIPTMRWSLARDRCELDRLFESWQTDALILKPSYTWGGTSVTCFTRDRLGDIEWNPQRDVFCPEVNPNDGDVYKFEMFGTTSLLGWKSCAPPARAQMSDGMVRGLFGAYGVRKLVDWPVPVLQAARVFGEVALSRGYGHVSLDFMRNRSGRFEAIEVNLGGVALWWTTQFRSFRRQYARAVHQMLIDRHHASRTPASAKVRLENWLAAAARKPKLLVREVQATRLRRSHTKKLESRLSLPETPPDL